MAKTNSSKSTPPGSNNAPKPNYAYKPLKIGAVIKRIMEEKKIPKETVAEFTGVTERTVERWFESAYQSIPRMMMLSELLGVDLLLLYRSNVKPLPNPLQEELDKQKGYVKHYEGIEADNERLKIENIKFAAQIEILQEQLDKRNGR